MLPPSVPTPPLLTTDTVEEVSGYVAKAYCRNRGSVVRAIAVLRSAFSVSRDVAENQSAAATGQLENVNGTVPEIDT